MEKEKKYNTEASLVVAHLNINLAAGLDFC